MYRSNKSETKIDRLRLILIQENNLLKILLILENFAYFLENFTHFGQVNDCQFQVLYSKGFKGTFKLLFKRKGKPS